MKKGKVLKGSTEVYNFICDYWKEQSEKFDDRPPEFPIARGTIRNQLSLLQIPIIYQNGKNSIIYCDPDEIMDWLDSNFVGIPKKMNKR